MGSVLEEITLRNGGDIVLARNGHIAEQDIRSFTVTALVDTGATTLVMGEDMREKLGLFVVETQTVTLAGGSEAFCGITEPVEICWKDRTSSVRAWVLPGEDQVLVGVIPLEEMDLIVDPANQKLVGAHGNKAMGLIK
jgi:clan AA aspartic protease